MKDKKIISVLFLLVFQLTPLRLWLKCKSFLDSIHFSYYDLKLQMIDLIHKDVSVPIIAVRFFHNKITQFTLDIYKRYTQFLDIGFFASFITFVGSFGMLMGIWYFLNSKKKDKRIAMVIFLSFFFPFIEVLVNPSLPLFIKIILIFAPFQILSAYGHYQFIKEKKSKLIIIVYSILIIISIIWIFFLPGAVYKFCEI
jgi:hypothetical protein